MKTYTAGTFREGKSFNPFSRNYETEFLLSELVTIAPDNIASYLESEKVKMHHKIIKEEKVAKSDVTVPYPTLTDFRRKTVSVKTAIQGNVPPDEVKIVLNKSNEEPFLTQRLYFDKLRNIDGHKEWFYSSEVNNKKIPLNALIEYNILSKDIMGNEDVVGKGEMRTIADGLFRMKQAEVLVHGTIITSFCGIFIVMLLYSL